MGTHCYHWWDADPDSKRGTACHYCGDDSTGADDTFSEHCPNDPLADDPMNSAHVPVDHDWLRR